MLTHDKEKQFVHQQQHAEHTLAKVPSINFEPPDIDLCSACHVYPISRGAWLFQYYS